MGALTGRLVAVSELTPRDLDAWRDLAASALEPNPLFEPECVVAAATHVAAARESALVVAERHGTFHACMPVKVSRQWGRAPVPAFTTDVRRMTYLGTPLVSATDGREALRTLFATLARHRGRGGARLAAVRWLHGDGPVAGLLGEAVAELGFAARLTEDFERPFVARRPDPTYGAHFNAKYRGVLNRRRRQLERELGGGVAVAERAGEPGALDELIAMEAAGHKGANGVALSAVPGETEYFRAMCGAFAAQGRLQLLALGAGGRTAAMQVALRGGDGLFALKVTHDEALARSGPGVQLQLASIEHFHDRTDAAWIDSCTYADNETLLYLYPDRRRIVSSLVALGSLEAGLVRALPHLRALRRGLRDAGARGRALASSARAAAGPDAP